MKIDIKKVKTNDKLRMTDNVYAASGFNKGDVVTVYSKQSGYIYVRNANGQNIACLPTNLESLALTKEDLIKGIKELEEEVSSYKDKLDWMEETGAIEYNETEVKVWKTLKTLSSTSTDIEKAKIIAKLISQ